MRGVPPVSSRAEIRKAVVRYGLYVNSRKWIDGIFNELDKDGSAARSECRLGSAELSLCVSSEGVRLAAPGCSEREVRPLGAHSATASDARATAASKGCRFYRF